MTTPNDVERQAHAIVQARCALDQMVADVRAGLASGHTEAEEIADLALVCATNPSKAISLAVIAVMELAKRGAS